MHGESPTGACCFVEHRGQVKCTVSNAVAAVSTLSRRPSRCRATSASVPHAARIPAAAVNRPEGWSSRSGFSSPSENAANVTPMAVAALAPIVASRSDDHNELRLKSIRRFACVAATAPAVSAAYQFHISPGGGLRTTCCTPTTAAAAPIAMPKKRQDLSRNPVPTRHSEAIISTGPPAAAPPADFSLSAQIAAMIAASVSPAATAVAGAAIAKSVRILIPSAVVAMAPIPATASAVPRNCP